MNIGRGKRNCCVFGCTNSDYQLLNWAGSHDCAKQTIDECDCKPPFELFAFPGEKTNPVGRGQWTKLVNRKDSENVKKVWKPNKSSRVCSNHFVDLKPTEENPYPALHLGYQKVPLVKKRKRPADRSSMNSTKAKKSASAHFSESTTTNESMLIKQPATSSMNESMEMVEQPATSSDVLTVTSSTLLHMSEEHLLTNSNALNPESSCGECHRKSKQINCLSNLIKKQKQSLHQLREKVLANTCKQKHFSHEILTTDKKVKFYTGIPTRKALDSLYDVLLPKVKTLKYWHGPSKVSSPVKRHCASLKKSGPSRKLSGKNEFLLTLIKLRLGLLNEDLGDRFGISRTTVSNILTTWLPFLSKNLVPCLVFNPPKEAVQSILPKSFKTSVYCNVRHIIDCTEIYIEKPKDLKLQALTWSDYKHHQTVKVLVSILPTGFFNFVSKAWGGRTSDNHLTRNCGFLDLVEPYDSVMADKGFQIREDLLLRRAEFHIPPGRRGSEQMSKADVRKTQEIANRRIYVEMAIRRLKTFRLIKNELPITLVSQIDNITGICAALCNLYPPLYKT